MSVAHILEPIVRDVLAGPGGVRLTCWDGSTVGRPDATVKVRFVSPRALERLLWAPNELGFARAYVAGDLEIDGDLFAALTEIDAVSDPERGPTVGVTPRTALAIADAARRLGVVGLRPKPPAEEVRIVGRRHSRARDAAAIAHHYDIGNDFYRLVLGPSMVYSCAYFERPPGPTYGLEDAQRAKLDLVARKLALRPGMRLLDVGCGWGGFVRHAAREYGVTAVGVTVSRRQAQWARDRVAEEGLTDRVEIRVQDYREISDGPFDAVASIGMAEHVGLSMLPDYARSLSGLITPGGRLLNHAIARPPGREGPRLRRSTSFIDRYVFPDGELVPLGAVVDTLESAGLEVRDVESLREHYALTLRAWVANLERHWEQAITESSPGRARVWRLYMVGSALAFEAGRIGVNQVLAVRPGERGRSGMPLTREALLPRRARVSA